MKKKLQYYATLIQDDVHIGIVDWFKKVSTYITPEKIHNLLILLIILSIVHVGITTYFYDPQFAYDESNTLNIAQTSVRDIWEILANEHNFTGYYYILYGFHQIGDVVQYARAFNFLVWIVSIMMFYKLLCFFLKTKTEQLYGTFLYTLLSIISYYAYYIRMYGLFVLIFLVYLYSFIQLSRTRTLVWLIFVSVSMMCMALLHPMTIVVAGVHIVLVWLSNDFRNKRNRVLAVGAGGVAVVLIQLGLKTGILSTFTGEGASYVFQSANLFLIYPARQMFGSVGTLNVEVYLLIVLMFYGLFTHAKRSLFQNKLLIVYGFLFGMFNIVATEVIPRHVIFFAPLLLLIVLVGLFAYPWKRTIKTALIGGIVFLFTTQSLMQSGGIDTYMLLGRWSCAALEEVNIDAVILDYTTYNAYIHCIQKEGIAPARVYITDPDEGLVDMSTLTSTEILYYQSKRGGSFDITSNRLSALYILGHVQNDPREVQAFRNAISHLDAESVAYIAPFEQKVFTYILYSDEAYGFSSYKFEQFYKPNIFVFTRKHYEGIPY